MAFNFKGQDWWTDRGWIPSRGACAVCDSLWNLAADPNSEPWAPLCEFHSKCQSHVIRLVCARRFGSSIASLITQKEWNKLRLNSFDRDTLVPYMSDEVLVSSTEYALKNCARFRISR